MATIRQVKCKNGTSYRVQVMKKGIRFDKTFETSVEAENFLSLVKTGNCAVMLTPTIKEIARRYLNDTTVRAWKNAVTHGNFWVDEIGQLMASEVSHKLVDEIVNSKADWSEATKSRYRSTLSMMYKNAGLMEFNPARNMSYSTSRGSPEIYANHPIAISSMAELGSRLRIVASRD